MSGEVGKQWELPVGVLLLLAPLAHPLLIPVVGVASHLLWFAHVLPVALVTFRLGRRGALATAGVSLLMVVGGERLLGGGYGEPAAWSTAAGLGGAVFFANALVAAFALHARRLARQYRLLFQTVSLGILLTDREGRILDANPSAAGTLGCPIPELRGLPLLFFLSNPGARSMEELERDGGWTGALEIRRGETSRVVQVFLGAVWNPETGQYQVIVSDRTAEILRDQEVQRTSKLATLGAAMAGLAHELKNPLTVILAGAESGVSSCPSPSPCGEILDIVQDQGRRMLSLLDELLGFSRAGGNGSVTRIRQFLPRLLKIQQMALPPGIRIRHRLDWSGPIPADPLKVEQVMLNLVANAADALRHSGREEGHIDIVVRREEGKVLLEVADDGPGISPPVLSILFQPFVTTRPPGEGTGLGLAISRRLARSMGGDLTAANRKEGGACFVLELPAGTATRQPLEGPPPISPQPASGG